MDFIHIEFSMLTDYLIMVFSYFGVLINYYWVITQCDTDIFLLDF